VKEEIGKKIADEIGALLVELKLRKEKILDIINEHINYMRTKRDEIDEMFEKLEKGLKDEELRELLHLRENILDVLDRERYYWYNAQKVIEHEIRECIS